MAASSLNFSSTTSLVTTTPKQNNQILFTKIHGHGQALKTLKNRVSSINVRAAKLPAGVEVPKVQPKFQAPFLGFTRTAEIWNSRACMIGLIGTFIVELILNKGILQVIGVDVGKGLDLPL